MSFVVAAVQGGVGRRVGISRLDRIVTRALRWRPRARPSSLFHEGVANPFHPAVLLADHVKAAGGLTSAEVAIHQAGKEIPGGPQQALLLVAVYTGSGSAV